VQTKRFSTGAIGPSNLAFQGQGVPCFRTRAQETAFAELQSSCERFVVVSTGRSETDLGWNVSSGSDEIGLLAVCSRCIRTQLLGDTLLNRQPMQVLYSADAT